jgi:hypothetical protein
MKHNIATGMRVEFDSDLGPQKRTVTGLPKDISNGQGHAVIEVGHGSGGCAWTIPVAVL